MNKILSTGLIAFALGFNNMVMAQSKDNWPSPIPNENFGQVLFDRLEYTRTDEQQNRAVWDMQAWYGGDYHRLVFKSEGENTQNDGMPTDLERAEVLYGYLVSAFWSVQVGVGTKGEMSSDADMENSLRINEDGDMQFINETEYDWQLSQVSYLQPRLEVVANLTDSEKYNRQSGLSNIRIGLRYRHEIVREIAPYVGVYYSKALGNTADALKADGESTSETGVVVGARIWF